MDIIKLAKPSMEYSDEIMNFRQELLDADSEFAGCGRLYSCTSADEWIKIIKRNEKEGELTSNSYLPYGCPTIKLLELLILDII